MASNILVVVSSAKSLRIYLLNSPNWVTCIHPRFCLCHLNIWVWGLSLRSTSTRTELSYFQLRHQLGALCILFFYLYIVIRCPVCTKIGPSFLICLTVRWLSFGLLSWPPNTSTVLDYCTPDSNLQQLYQLLVFFCVYHVQFCVLVGTLYGPWRLGSQFPFFSLSSFTKASTCFHSGHSRNLCFPPQAI